MPAVAGLCNLDLLLAGREFQYRGCGSHIFVINSDVGSIGNGFHVVYSKINAEYAQHGTADRMG